MYSNHVTAIARNWSSVLLLAALVSPAHATKRQGNAVFKQLLPKHAREEEGYRPQAVQLQAVHLPAAAPSSPAVFASSEHPACSISPTQSEGKFAVLKHSLWITCSPF